MNADSSSIIDPEPFIHASRDFGYNGISAAVAELIDNSLQAHATRISICVLQGENERPDVVVADNGIGMDRVTTQNALRFGWSTRFDNRDGAGRFGIGLPAASLSHARRVEVWSSPDGNRLAGQYLDLDASDKMFGTANVNKTSFLKLVGQRRGTVVFWKKCDRLSKQSVCSICDVLSQEIGRLFRYKIWSGLSVFVNENKVLANDPTFLFRTGDLKASQFGPELCFPFRSPRGDSTVRVTFSELPVERLRQYPNSAKASLGISKGAGISILRAGREVDYGWHFTGSKRKENYDDWWRCEIHFEPVLDELFGLTNTKQRVNPSPGACDVLTPAIESIARILNGRVRSKFRAAKPDRPTRLAEKVAISRDPLMVPPIRTLYGKGRKQNRGCSALVAGLDYRFEFSNSLAEQLYETVICGTRVRVCLNTKHPFVTRFMGAEDDIIAFETELLLLAAARAELDTSRRSTRREILRFKTRWSQVLAAFVQ